MENRRLIGYCAPAVLSDRLPINSIVFDMAIVPAINKPRIHLAPICSAEEGSPSPSIFFNFLLILSLMFLGIVLGILDLKIQQQEQHAASRLTTACISSHGRYAATPSSCVMVQLFQQLRKCISSHGRYNYVIRRVAFWEIKVTRT